MKVKLLQFGDLHMDAPFTSLSDMEGKPSQRRLDLKKTLSRLMNLAVDEKADLVLVCGDLYEHSALKIRSTISAISLPGYPILLY